MQPPRLALMVEVVGVEAFLASLSRQQQQQQGGGGGGGVGEGGHDPGSGQLPSQGGQDQGQGQGQVQGAMEQQRRLQLAQVGLHPYLTLPDPLLWA